MGFHYLIYLIGLVLVSASPAFAQGGCDAILSLIGSEIGARGFLSASNERLSESELSQLRGHGVIPWDEHLYFTNYDSAHRLNFANARMRRIRQEARRLSGSLEPGGSRYELPEVRSAIALAMYLQDRGEHTTPDDLQRGLFIVDDSIDINALTPRDLDELVSSIPKREIYVSDGDFELHRLDQDLVKQRFNPAQMQVAPATAFTPLHVKQRGLFRPARRLMVELADLRDVSDRLIPSLERRGLDFHLAEYLNDVVLDVSRKIGGDIKRVGMVEGHVDGETFFVDHVQYGHNLFGVPKMILITLKKNLAAHGVRRIDVTKVWELRHLASEPAR